MPLLEKQLVVKRSTLKGAGKGLFTNIDIPRGKKIVEYKGKVTSWKEVDDKKGLNGYIYYVSKDHVIDASETKEALARYANDAKGLSQTEGIRNNCTYEIEGKKVYIKAMKNIPAGSELLVGYGKEYWTIIKENWGVK
ncbi:MAG: SET domain-containing protein [Bacteroidetes bacterium]|nr:SET domain-containing protein [Bacteroidota bacterium]